MTESEYIDFRVELGKWKYSQRALIEDDLKAEELPLLARATEGVDGVQEYALKKIVNLSPLEPFLAEARREKDLGKALAIFSSRKFGAAVNEISSGEKRQAKEQKEIQQFIRLYSARKILSENGFFLNYGMAAEAAKNEKKEVGNFGEGYIQFISTYPKWKCIKKYRVTAQTDSRTLAEFMSAYCVSLDQKFEFYLRQFFDMGLIDEQLKKGPAKGASYSEIVVFLNGSELSATLTKALKKNPAANHGIFLHYLRAYAARKALRERGLFVEYSQVDVPGLKRLLKKKKEKN